MSAQLKEKTVLQIAQAGKKSDKSQTKSVDLLEGRASAELVVAFMGAVGCGLARIITEYEEQLKGLDYRVIRIKLSEFIKAQRENGTITSLMKKQRFRIWQTRLAVISCARLTVMKCLRNTPLAK